MTKFNLNTYKSPITPYLIGHFSNNNIFQGSTLPLNPVNLFKLGAISKPSKEYLSCMNAQYFCNLYLNQHLPRLPKSKTKHSKT